MSLDLQVQYAMPETAVPGVEDFRRWAQAALAARPGAAELVVRVVDRAESADLNRRYRGKTGPTNVLSFPFEPPPQVASCLLGDLVICAPVVRAEAAEQGKSEASHWAHMVVHGVLHLLGYDHQSEAEAQRMEDREREVLAGLGYPDPYAEE